MNCPRCKKDYRDVPEGRAAGHFYRSDDHFCKDYRRFGMQCTNCGYVAEMITKPTGLPYKKREIKDDPDQFPMFDEMDDTQEHKIVNTKIHKIKKQKVRG